MDMISETKHVDTIQNELALKCYLVLRSYGLGKGLKSNWTNHIIENKMLIFGFPPF